MKVKLYGSASFSPVGSGLAGDEVQPRVSFPSLWTGQVGDGTYDSYAWRTDGDWCYGAYARDDWNGNAGCKCGLTVIQNSDNNSGFDIGLNWNNRKRILARVGHDLPSGALIKYVRVHILCVNNDKNPYILKPYYQVIGTQGDATSPFAGGPTGEWGDFFDASSRSGQSSIKWEASPVPGRNFDKDALFHTAWGVISGNASPGNGVFVHVSEMAIEIGYDDSPYVVTTGSATPSATSAVLRGSVNPKGDPPGTWFFQYGLNQFLGNATAEVPAPSNALYNVELLLNGLPTETTHYYRLVARDSAGNLNYGAIRSFYTVSMCSTRPLLVL
jgi:hypothetical protein